MTIRERFEKETGHSFYILRMIAKIGNDNQRFNSLSKGQTKTIQEEYEWMANKICELQSLLEWVPVSERLPDERVNVFVYGWVRVNGLMTHKRTLSMLIEGFWCEEDDEDTELCLNVTHWLPLPPLPEDV